MREIFTGQKIMCDIAHYAFSIINQFLSQDQIVCSLLRTTNYSSHQFFREETITEVLVSNLVCRFPDNIEITLFTIPEEHKNGADWYWRIEHGKYATHARVQAKRVHRKKHGQPDEKGSISIDTKQLNHLVTETQNDANKIYGLEAWLASYARFDASPPCGKSNLQKCNYHHHSDPCENILPSLWIAKAQKLVDIHKSKNKSTEISIPVEKIVKESLRLDCLLPCIETDDCINNVEPNNLIGPSKKGFNLNGDLQSYEDCVEIIRNNRKLSSKFQGAIRIQISC